MCGGWVENPYWQVFPGETYLQTGPPIIPSILARWRQRLGEASMEELQPVPVAAAKDGGLLRAAIVKTVIVVGTTVAPESVAHPTDSRVLEHSRQHLVKAAAEHGLKLRVRAACARGRVVHQQGQGQNAVRVWGESVDRDHAQGRFVVGGARDAGQSV